MIGAAVGAFVTGAGVVGIFVTGGTGVIGAIVAEAKGNGGTGAIRDSLLDFDEPVPDLEEPEPDLEEPELWASAQQMIDTR